MTEPHFCINGEGRASMFTYDGLWLRILIFIILTNAYDITPWLPPQAISYISCGCAFCLLVIKLWHMSKCVCCTVACTHSSCLRRGLGCDENTHLWLKQALLSCVCSQLYLSSPPCPSISWRRCLLSGRWDTAWLCTADVHHGSDISIETAGWYLVVIFHRRRCCFF